MITTCERHLHRPTAALKTHLLHHGVQCPATRQGLVGLADAPAGFPPPASCNGEATSFWKYSGNIVGT